MNKIITFLLIVTSFAVNAQVTETIHQTFEVSEEVTQVSFDIYDEFETEPWASNNIMVVTTVELHSGAQHILDFYIKQGRYELEETAKDVSLSLVSKDKQRKGMKYKDFTVYEQVKMKMYIPENFDRNGNQLIKKVEETVSTDQ